MTNEQLQGSQTAKNGFKNEDDIVDKFNNWNKDEDATFWCINIVYFLPIVIFLSYSIQTTISPIIILIFYLFYHF